MTAPRAVLLMIGASAAVRLLLGAVLGLSEDEAYTVARWRRLSLSYFDHPPLVYWLTGAATRLAGTEDALAVRLSFVALFAGTTWLVFRIGGRLFGDRVGLVAALLPNLVLYLSTKGLASGCEQDREWLDESRHVACGPGKRRSRAFPVQLSEVCVDEGADPGA